MENRVVDWVTGDLSKSLGEIRGPNPFLGTSQREVLTHRGRVLILKCCLRDLCGLYRLNEVLCHGLQCLQVCKKGRNTKGIEYIDF